MTFRAWSRQIAQSTDGQYIWKKEVMNVGEGICLFKLVNSKDAPGVFPVGTRFFTVTSAVTSVSRPKSDSRFWRIVYGDGLQ